jgi:Protein of unknown function (DUF3187)
MDLQGVVPARGRCASGLGWAILALLCLALTPLSARAADNFGLGPLSVRNQFPITLRFLDYTPDAPGTLPSGTVQLRYQYELTNTFINTQSPLANNGAVIDTPAVLAGLTAANFPPSGYGLYIDVESRRQLVRLDYGLFDSLEVGLELAWLSFGGGRLDSRIEGVERFFGGLNPDRNYSPRDRYDFYVARDGALLTGSSQPFSNVMQDPVLNLKWNLSEGGEVLPALTLKLSYKRALDDTPMGEHALVSSGGNDAGYYLLISKAVGDVVGHIQFGATHLQVQPNTFASTLRHRMYGLEFRLDPANSLLVQSVTQSSIFLRPALPGTSDFDISRPTDVLVLGYRHVGTWVVQLGTIEDYNQQRNEADITFFLELGVRW